MADKSELPIEKSDPTMVLILGLFTCGICNTMWHMKAAKVFNKLAGKELIPPVVAILAGFCWPVSGYFWYLASQTFGELGTMLGKPEELKSKSTLLIVLGTLLSPVAAMILQGHFNELLGDSKPAA